MDTTHIVNLLQFSCPSGIVVVVVLFFKRKNSAKKRKMRPSGRAVGEGGRKFMQIPLKKKINTHIERAKKRVLTHRRAKFVVRPSLSKHPRPPPVFSRTMNKKKLSHTHSHVWNHMSIHRMQMIMFMDGPDICMCVSARTMIYVDRNTHIHKKTHTHNQPMKTNWNSSK